jgi:hypothetical protein
MQPLSPSIAAVMSMMASSFFIFVLLYTGPTYWAPPVVKGTPPAGSNGWDLIRIPDPKTIHLRRNPSYFELRALVSPRRRMSA